MICQMRAIVCKLTLAELRKEAPPFLFTYGASGWKDKLTAFNGVGISYDEIDVS